jgi:prolyl oligopeptidase
MKTFSFFLILSFAFALVAQNISYPISNRSNHVDEYHGHIVPDPYRWLEDETSPDVKQWIEEQNKVTFKHLEEIPFRDGLRKKLENIFNYERYSLPSVYDNTFIFSKNSGMQNQSPIYYKQSHHKEPVLLIDPNELSEDGTVSITGYSLSKDEKYFAYSISRGGSDWNEIFIIDLQTGAHLSDHLKWIKFSGISWYKDGFFYSRYQPEDEERALSGKNEFHSVYYHKLNTEQQHDILIYRNYNEPLRTYAAFTDKEQQYLLLSEKKSTSNNALYFKKAGIEESEFIPITNQDFIFDYSFIDIVNGKFLLKTNEQAPKYKLILIEPSNPAKSNWKEFITEQKYVIQQAMVTKDYVVISVLENAYNKILVYDFNGKQILDIELPGIGSVSGISGNKNSNTIYYSFMSYTYPSSIFIYDIDTRGREVFFRPDIDFNFDLYETKQVFYTSADGTKIPMFITLKKGTVLDGNNPVLLYGYGGFNVSLTPRFSIGILPFLENGGIYAVANIRGGGEFGKEWHLAGTKLQKQNVFDDFIAAAEYLIIRSYTNASRLAIQGGSNGGLLVAACMIQRPDLFKVALPAVGVMDMLRYHKFTIGWAWVNDYGSSDNLEEFTYLMSYSPIHTMKQGTAYPATLVTTADHDDRVVPAHSYKFIAELQHQHSGKNPVLIRIETQAGHGAGKPIAKIIDEVTDVQSFMMYHLGMNPKF